MKKILFLLTVSMLATVGFAQAKKNRNTVTYSVDLHCQKCVDKIQKNISFEKGVTDLQQDLKKKQVVVQFNSQKTDTTKLKAAFSKLGYDVKTLQYK